MVDPHWRQPVVAVVVGTVDSVVPVSSEVGVVELEGVSDVDVVV